VLLRSESTILLPHSCAKALAKALQMKTFRGAAGSDIRSTARRCRVWEARSCNWSAN